MMTDMIERVARAILKVQFYDGEEIFYDGMDGFYRDIDPDHYFTAMAMARAAIEAMRKPTKEMLVAGNDATKEHIDFYDYDSGASYEVEPLAAFAALNAMINAAIGKTSEGKNR